MQIFAKMQLPSYRHWEMDLPEILGTLWKLFVTVLLPNAKFWCVVSITFSVSLFGLYLRTKRNLRSAEYFLNVIRDVSKALARNHEVVAFGENGDVIYTTHPQLYENKEEFMQNLSGRVTASDNFQKFCKSFEENMPNSTTISGSGSGLHNQFKKWLATIGLLDKQNTLIGEQILVVTISDASRQFAEAEKIATSYDRLENFLDYFPFGIFYINNTGEILGTNTTFANLVSMQKEKLIGINITEFISNFDSNIPVQKPIGVLVKPRFTRNVAAMMVKSPVSAKSSAQPWIILKLSQGEMSFFERRKEPEASAFISSCIPSVITTTGGEIVSRNPAFEAFMKGQTIKHGDTINELIHKDYRETFSKALMITEQGTINDSPIEIKLKDGSAITMAHISKIEHHMNDSAIQILIQFIDMSSQKIFETQFLQSQKLQAIGQLTGGIAHDFNNLLTAMIGFCDLLLQRYTPGEATYGDVIQIKQNAERAANLVKKLLTYTKKQTIKPKSVSVTEILMDIAPLLRRLIGVDADIKITHGQGIWNVRIDSGELEQVIINLVVNARDAVGNKGQIEVRTSNFYSDKAFTCVYEKAHPGDYVLIEVRDNGHGIAPDDIDHIFEPFFTKKDETISKRAGQGTGLGLSTVYGVITQAGGYIKVTTELGTGTTFRIYLPRYDGIDADNHEKEKHTIDLSGNETILLVEDENSVRMFTARALQEKGYKILEASCGDEALKIADNEQFDLLITDVIMPKMDGPTLSNVLKARNPALKTIFISGYTEDTFRHDVAENADIHFMQKPFTMTDLLKKVKKVLINAK